MPRFHVKSKQFIKMRLKLPKVSDVESQVSFTYFQVLIFQQVQHSFSYF